MRMVALGEVARIFSGATPKTDIKDYWEGEIPWVTPADLSKLDGAFISDTPRRLTDAGVRSCATTVLPVGSVLLSSRAPIGHVAINTVPMATNQGFKSLVPGRRLDAKYLYHWLRSRTAHLQSLGNGATFKELSKGTTERIEIPLPPLPQQRRTAAILDHADALRAKRRQVLVRFDTLTQSIFRDFFWRTPQRTAPLAEIAEKVVVGHVGPTSEHFRPSGVPFLRTSNIGNSQVIRTDLAHVTAEFHAALKKSQLHTGDVLISRVITDEVRAAIIPADLDGANCANIIVVRPSGDLFPETILGFLGLPATQRCLVGRRVGSAQGVVNTSVLKELEVPVYDRTDQSDLRDSLGMVDRQRALAARMTSTAEELFASLQSRAFRAEL